MERLHARHFLCVLAGALLLWGCGSQDKASVLVEIVNGTGMPADPEALRVFLHDSQGTPLFDDERMPEQGTLTPVSSERLGSVVLRLGNATGDMELNVFATKQGARVGRGRVRLYAARGVQTRTTLTLVPTEAWPDTEDLLGLGPNGEPCADSQQCLSGACVDGICCGEKQCGSCQACNLPGTAGLCAPVPQGETDSNAQDACEDGRSCDGQGTCRAQRGQTCKVNADCAQANCVNGVCCDSGCKACDGSGGCAPQCQNDGDCGAGQGCDKGACVARIADGATCATAASCASGSCLDGRCCKASCGPCMACTGPGGTCMPRAAGQQDGAPHFSCTGTLACNGRGACGRSNGERCSNSGECAAGHCVSGVCCDSTCSGSCRNCGGGTCKPIVNAVDPRSCSGTQMCDGLGNCAKVIGQRCGSGGECASGFCVDGSCCNSACDESCFSCSTGTCTLKINTTDVQCTAGRRCDSAGLCR